MTRTNIDFPFHISRRGRTAVTSNDDHIRDLIEQLIFTAPGERVNRPDLGSGLQQLVFAPNSPELAATLQHLLQSNLQQWLGNLIKVDAVSVEANEAELHVAIRYTVLRTQELRTERFIREV